VTLPVFNLALARTVPHTFALAAAFGGFLTTQLTLRVLEHLQMVQIPHVLKELLFALQLLFVFVQHAADQNL